MKTEGVSNPFSLVTNKIIASKQINQANKMVEDRDRKAGLMQVMRA